MHALRDAAQATQPRSARGVGAPRLAAQQCARAPQRHRAIGGGHGRRDALKADAERKIILGALERHEWQITRAAESLGLADHASLLKIMRRLGIQRD
ncbi:MAG: hypothetical protein B7X11_02000 [Acidobacteria bacterium 37-65-4]|nr:MAG: hypothetical protein B7X11_02000 [Acidobacteria bacterium 37-65-4]